MQKALTFNHVRMAEQPVLVLDVKAVLNKEGLILQFTLEELMDMLSRAKALGHDPKSLILWCRELKLQDGTLRIVG
jgi:hypothetical protein